MNEKIFVGDLAENEVVQSIFLVSKKTVREARNGQPYLSVSLTDKSGVIEARAWDNAIALASRFEVDDFVMVRGRVGSYREQLQIIIEDIALIDDKDVDVESFLPTSSWSSQALFEQLCELLDEVMQDNELRRFFEELFAQPERRQRFLTAPAAMSNHHNYIGGLIEHSLSMARVGIALCDHYEAYYPGLVNRDLVVSGCVLHDIGKCEELTYSRSFNYSTEGRLVGHIVRGVEVINEVVNASATPFCEELMMQLKHLVLSHHGKMEYGAPVLPRTPEAILLHQIDMIDSRMNMLAPLYDRQNAASESGEWTDYQRLFDGSMYIGGGISVRSSHTNTEPELIGPGKKRSTNQPVIETQKPSAHTKQGSVECAVAPAEQPRAKKNADDPTTVTLDLFDKF